MPRMIASPSEVPEASEGGRLAPRAGMCGFVLHQLGVGLCLPGLLTRLGGPLALLEVLHLAVLHLWATTVPPASVKVQPRVTIHHATKHGLAIVYVGCMHTFGTA
eukprot:scaffold91704_cov18-Prasinocladus_malaysianus.AAC.1